MMPGDHTTGEDKPMSPDDVLTTNAAFTDFAFVNAEQKRSNEPPLIERLLDVVDAHAQAEADSLAAYAKLRDAGDPVMALIMTLVLEDEERHHSLLRRISATLHDDIQWAHSADALPTGAEPTPPVTPDLLTTLRDLLHEENEAVSHLRKVAHELRTFHGGVDTALIELTAMDSQKHAHLLEFLLHRAQEKAKAQS